MAVTSFTFLLKCEDELEARRLAPGIRKLRAFLSVGHAADENETGESLLCDRVHVRITLNDYLPAELNTLLDDISATRLDVLTLCDQLKAFVTAFLDVYRGARIVNRVPDLSSVVIAPSSPLIQVSVAPAKWPERRAKWMDRHAGLLRVLHEVQLRLDDHPVDVVSIRGTSEDIRVFHGGVEVRLTPAVKRAVAVLALKCRAGKISVAEFCEHYTGMPLEKRGDDKASFDTAVRPLKTHFPALSWKSDYKGGREITGLVIRSDLTPERLQAFVEISRPAS